MKVSSRYPAGACLGGDFIARHNELGEGERVVELEIDIETLPGWGLLCISETTVKGIVRELGLDILDNESADKIRATRKELEALREENATLAGALARCVRVAYDVGIIIEAELVDQ